MAAPVKPRTLPPERFWRWIPVAAALAIGASQPWYADAPWYYGSVAVFVACVLLAWILP
jgi:hypothetical protein